MEHLIANSGIHFITREIEFNFSEPLLLGNGKTLKYSFYETTDFLEGIKLFGLLYYNADIGKYIPVDELLKDKDSVERRPTGREELDDTGVVKMIQGYPTTLFTTYPDGAPEILSINSLQSFRVKSPEGHNVQVSAFELLLDIWLPMPMFRQEVDGITSAYPLGWCRMKMQRIGEGSKKGNSVYRLTWAFDTQLATDELSVLRPYIADYDGGSVSYAMCNKADYLLNFMASTDEFHAFSDYIASLLGMDITKNISYKFKAFYIYFLNFIRLSGAAPEVTLHDGGEKKIPVDLVLDIGNSRTCGILFEEGKFTKGKMLELRDISNPWMFYENKTFDMRIVFRKADFGNDIVLEEDLFRWKSFVRIGDEAQRLLYRSLEEEGLSEKTTNYSSPKRYLWDLKEYDGQWENLITTDDSFNVRLLGEDISVTGLSELFDNDGSYTGEDTSCDIGTELFDFEGKKRRYSRASLMTFAFVEIFQHAISQINSIRYRDKWGNVDLARYIRNVIVTCPTAMPLAEQVRLRQSAHDAFHALTRCEINLSMPKIFPSTDALKVTDPYAPAVKKTWSYDEATCCQLTYLCAEIAQRYSGEIHKFFELKGHVRPELKEQGNENKSLTIGTVDIGAGTTDVMICSYEYMGKGNSRVIPTPLYWDSFYLAGDDILRNLVQNILIEGKEHNHANLGNISSALVTRILSMTDDELRKLPCLDNVVYKNKVDDICATAGNDDKAFKKVSFASNLIHDFFGTDSSMMGFRDRRCRVDFNTQISVPIVQRMMELLRTRRPSKLYTNEDLIATVKPAGYLLDYFEHHFGFRFEELNWRFDPKEVANIVKATMEPLMKQLAMVMYAHHCDIILLAGRPTSLDAITELFIKYVPISPDRLVRLNDYRVGSWFPTADGQGYFYDQKSIVAVGAMVGFHASANELNGLVVDFDKMIKTMRSTANYIGEYNSRRLQVTNVVLSPESSTSTMDVQVFPAFLGCRLLNSDTYQARPLYAIYNKTSRSSLHITLSRDFYNDKECLMIEEVTDSEGNTLPKSSVELVQQSLVNGGMYWLDKGEFELTVK